MAEAGRDAAAAAASILSAVNVVLFEPQDPVNIAATVRAMKNMGVPGLRLVNPVAYDPNQIEGVAHDTRDLVERIRRFDRLEGALADCVRVAGFTARRRAAKRAVVEPRAAAEDLLAHAAHGPVALLFGREDDGLPNWALDRAHVVVTIPTTSHSSLNLAQAVLLGCYELHLRAADATRPLAPPRKDAPPAAAEHYETFFADAEQALAAIDFFKTRQTEAIMRTVRSLTYRAAPDRREIGLARAMAIEVVRAIDRVRREAGLPPREAPSDARATVPRAPRPPRSARGAVGTDEGLRQSLLAMAAEDRRVADELAADGSLHEGYHPRMEEVHRRNAAELRRIVGRHGWPGRSLVGGDGAQAAWLVAQHAIGEPDFLRRSLELLREAAARGEVPRWQVAYLEDRIRVLEGKPQRYGTQLEPDEDGTPHPLPIEDPALVDERRREMGLEPLAEAVRRHRERATPREDARDPERRARREREYEAWLRKVGWR